MKALSVRQPWAWLIVRPELAGADRAAAIAACDLKDIENRTWPTKLRGRFLIHASKGMTRAEYDDVEAFLDHFAIRHCAARTGKTSSRGHRWSGDHNGLHSLEDPDLQMA